MSESLTLHGRARNGLRLSEALEICMPALEARHARTIALLYSPGQSAMALLNDRKLSDCRDKAIVLDDVFEARIFNKQAELRWRNHEGGRGRAVLLSAPSIPATCQKQLGEDVSLEYLDRLPQTYLLWGEGVKDQAASGLANGWSRLTTARIGALNVPISVPNAAQTKDKSKMPRVILHVCEYLIADEDHGNVTVVEERLLELEAV